MDHKLKSSNCFCRDLQEFSLYMDLGVDRILICKHVNSNFTRVGKQIIQLNKPNPTEVHHE